MTKSLTHTGLALLFLGTFCATTSVARAEERVRIVGQANTPCPNAQYTTIKDAVHVVDPGDVIEICPALYSEQLIITKRLTLRGRTREGERQMRRRDEGWLGTLKNHIFRTLLSGITGEKVKEHI
jgi:nitrous oxidase accessory protein NosD